MLGNVAIWGMVMYNVRKAQYIVVNHYFMEATILKKLISIILFVFITGVLSGCSKAGGYYNNGRKSLASGDYEEAAKYLMSAISENPNRANYYIDYGMALIGQGRYDEAISQFDQVIMDKKILMVLQNNKQALRGRGIAYFSMSNYREAINQFDKALDISVLSELNMDILYYKGKALMAIGDYNGAIDTYTKLIEEFGEDAQVLGERAYTYQKIGEYEKGLDDFDKAIALEDDNFDYYFGKYYLLKDLDRHHDAQEVLRRAAEIKIDTKSDKFNLAKIHFYQGLYDQALAELGESFTDGFSESYLYIGEIYNEKKDYSTAKYYYETYIEEGGVINPSAYNQIASLLIKMEDYDQALPYLEEGISLYKNTRQNNVMRVLQKNEIIVYEYLGMFDKALNKLQAYVATYPKDEEAKRELAFIKSRLE